MRYLTIKLLLFVLFAQPVWSDENRTILVTGGAGYIGSHTCKALSEAGFFPVVYGHINDASKTFGPVVGGDLLDLKALKNAIAAYNPCAIIHLASLQNIGEAAKDPEKYYLTNVVGTLNVLRSMRECGVKYILCASSCTVFGPSKEDYICEDHNKNPASPYSMTKYVSERMIEDFSKAYGFKHAILRFFNVSGVDVEGGLTRSQTASLFLIPRTIHAALGSNSALTIFGNDYLTPDGTAVRDYIHVKDVARGFTMALNHLLEGKESISLNLGSGKGYSVLEIINEVEKATQKTVPYRLASRREGDMAKAVADVTRSKEMLNYTTLHSDLITIVESEWQSIQKEVVK